MNTFEPFHQHFTALLPELTRMAASHFRHLDPEARDEAVQNTLALAWQAFAALIARGRADEPNILKSVVWYSVRQTKAGRHLTGSGNTNAKEATTAASAGKAAFERIDLREFVADTTPIPEQVSFRIDFPAFLSTLTERQRRMATDLMAGERTQDVARKYGVTSGAVSQFRTRFADLYSAFVAG